MIKQVLYDDENDRIITGFYIYGTEFLPGDRVWVDTVDHEHLKGTILDIFTWNDVYEEIQCIELEDDQGEYYALDDYMISFMEYVQD